MTTPPADDVLIEDWDKSTYIAKDEEFERCYQLADAIEGWKLNYEDKKKNVTVHIKSDPNSPINCIRVHTHFDDVDPAVLYDVLQDHYFRRTWDGNMLEGSIIEMADPFNEVGYYACKMPVIANRDFCNHRAWRYDEDRGVWIIFNKSVLHPGCPEEPSYVRGWSLFSFYFLRKVKDKEGCEVIYYTQNNPRGWLPATLINIVSSKVAPNLLTNVHAEALKYPEWKKTNHPDWRPWITGYDPKEEPYCQHKVTDKAKANYEKKKADVLKKREKAGK